MAVNENLSQCDSVWSRKDGRFSSGSDSAAEVTSEEGRKEHSRLRTANAGAQYQKVAWQVQGLLKKASVVGVEEASLPRVGISFS